MAAGRSFFERFHTRGVFSPRPLLSRFSVMTKPPLIPVLGLTAVLGAVFFLVFAMPPRDPQSLAEAAHNAQVLQRRAAEAAKLAGAASAVPSAIADAASTVPHPSPPGTTAEAGRVKAARREFLLHPDHWLPEKAEELRAAAGPFHEWRSRWVARILRAQWGDQYVTGSVGMQTYRRKMDALCADLTKLRPAARKQWDEWEAGNWVGWTPLPLEPEADSPATSQQRASADLLFRHTAFARPLLDEYEYLEDLPRDIEAKFDSMMPVGKAHALDLPREVELAAAEAQLDRVRRELAALAAQTSAERRQWQSRAWDGYVIENTVKKAEK